MAHEIPEIVDNDEGEISAVYDGNVIRGWFYRDGAQLQKMREAREFVEGWYQAVAFLSGKPLVEAIAEGGQ